MPLETQTGQAARQTEVLTLAEAASFLRVTEESLRSAARAGQVPAQRIGQEWRFMKQGLAHWLLMGRRPHTRLARYGRRVRLSLQPAQEPISARKEASASEQSAGEPHFKPGSKEAILQNFGIIKDDPDGERILEEIYARRKAGGE